MKCPEKIGVCESHAVEILLEIILNKYLQFLSEKKFYIFLQEKTNLILNYIKGY